MSRVGRGVALLGLLLHWAAVVEGAVVQLQWEYPASPPIATFRLYRQAGACPVVMLPPAPLASVAGTVRQYTDTTVPLAGTVCWVLVAVDAAGRASTPSNAVQHPQAPVAAPTGLRLVP